MNLYYLMTSTLTRILNARGFLASSLENVKAYLHQFSQHESVKRYLLDKRAKSLDGQFSNTPLILIYSFGHSLYQCTIICH